MSMLRLSAIAALLVSASAFAHPEFNPDAVNRYAKFDLVSGTSLRLAYTLMVGVAPALQLRTQFDRDHSGRLDDQEMQALLSFFRFRVEHGLVLELDGKPLAPAFEPLSELERAAGAEPFSIDLIATLPCLGRVHRVHFEDNVEFAPVGESEIVVLESLATELQYSRRGGQRNGHDKQTRFLFRTPKFSALEDRSVEFGFAAMAPAPVAQHKKAWWLMLALLSVGVLLLGYRKLKG